MTSPLLDPALPLTRAAIRNAAVQLLDTYVQEVQGRIYRARAWPTQANVYPCLLVYAMQTQDSVLSAAGMPTDFEVELTLAVHIRLEAVAADGNRAEEVAETALDALAAKVQEALRGPAEWLACFSRLGQRSYAAQVQQSGDRVTAEAVCTQVVVYQDWYQAPAYPQLASVGGRVDAVDPADLAGTYTVPAPFPAVAAAPRTAGPDGRAETSIETTFS